MLLKFVLNRKIRTMQKLGLGSYNKEIIWEKKLIASKISSALGNLIMLDREGSCSTYVLSFFAEKNCNHVDKELQTRTTDAR